MPELKPEHIVSKNLKRPLKLEKCPQCDAGLIWATGEPVECSACEGAGSYYVTINQEKKDGK